MKFHHKKMSLSQFTRDKLHQDYNPIYSAQRFKHFVDLDRKKRFMNQVKDQNNTSNKALSQIKRGRFLQIDLNTRLNFKTVSQLKTQEQTDQWSIDKYKRATVSLVKDLDNIKSKKKILHDKIKAHRQLGLPQQKPSLPLIKNSNVNKIPAYKLRVLKKQKQLIKLYPLKYLKPQLLQKFRQIYSSII